MSTNKTVLGLYSSVEISILFMLVSFDFVTVSVCYNRTQERCAIAKMTAQCALYMGVLIIFGTP